MQCLNKYFTQQERTSNHFFKQLLEEKGQWDTFKVYRVMQLQECIKRGEVVCKYGEIGDRFYVVLRGTVGIKVPTEVSIPDCQDYLEVLNVVHEH
jgi:CRP-like cAMP-binding protein